MLETTCDKGEGLGRGRGRRRPEQFFTNHRKTRGLSHNEAEEGDGGTSTGIRGLNNDIPTTERPEDSVTMKQKREEQFGERQKYRGKGGKGSRGDGKTWSQKGKRRGVHSVKSQGHTGSEGDEG